MLYRASPEGLRVVPMYSLLLEKYLRYGIVEACTARPRGYQDVHWSPAPNSALCGLTLYSALPWMLTDHSQAVGINMPPLSR